MTHPAPVPQGPAPSPSRKIRSRGAILVLILAATATILFTATAGAFLYLNTRRLTTAADLVEHTQTVLLSLQRASQQSDRIQYRTRIYLLSGGDDNLDFARRGANQFAATAIHIQTLVYDNPNQADNAATLVSCANSLTQTMNGFTRSSALPDLELQRCQKTISLMSDQEQMLLTQRTASSQSRLVASVFTEITFIGLSILVFGILFAILLRDTLRRQRIGKRVAAANDRLAKTVQAMEETAQQSSLMTAARNELQLCVNVQQVYDTAAGSFSRLLPGTGGCLYIINNSRQNVEVVSSWGSVNLDDFSPPDNCCGLRSGQPRWRQPGISEIHCAHFSGQAPDRYLCRPIVAHGNTIGILYVQCDTDELVELVNARMDNLRQLLQITGLAVATLNLQSKLENQSIRDSLTGLFNRHFMQMSMEREMARAKRRKQIMAVLMLDVDHFKKFNDTHGHAAGDAVLKAVSEVFAKNVRTEDIACRYGGEEFTIILPDTSVEGACDRADSILSAVSLLRVQVGNEIFGDLSVSIGLSFFPGDGDTSDQLLQRADTALYRAKRQGRNRLSLYENAFAEK